MKPLYGILQVNLITALRIDFQTARARLAMWHQRKALVVLKWASELKHSSSPEIIKNLDDIEELARLIKRKIIINQFIVDCNTLMKQRKFHELHKRIESLKNEDNLKKDI